MSEIKEKKKKKYNVRFLPIFPLNLFSPVVNVYQTLGRGV